MPLTIVTQPKEYNYSNDPITFEVVPSDAFLNEVSGVLMTQQIDLSGSNATAGDTITFSFNNQAITFTCVVAYAPTDEANTFPELNGALVDDWQTDFTNALFSNFFFAKNFKLISIINNLMKLECQQHSADFDISHTLTGGANVTLITQGVLPSTPDNYEIVCDIRSNVMGASEETTDSIAIKPSTTTPYHAIFHLENILDARLKSIPPSVGIHQATSLHRRFYMAFAEKYGNPAIEKAANVTNPYIVIKGGTDWVFIQESIAYDLSDYLRSFLTNQPSTKKTAVESPEYLYFYNKNFNGNLILHVVIEWTGGSTTTHNAATIPMTDNQMWVIPCGSNQLGIVHPVFPTKKPLKWQVSLAEYGFFGFNNHYSNVQTYDATNQCEGKNLMFANNRGGMDTIRVHDSLTQYSIKSQSERLQRVWRKDTFAAVEIYRKTSVKVFKVKTVLLDKTEAEWLSEIFQSKNVWETSETGTYIPIVINSESVQLTDGIGDLFNIEFEYQYAINY